MQSIPWVRYVFVILLTGTSNISSILVPPYLKQLQYDYTSIGFLVALTGIASLASRFPTGAFYSPHRARVMSTVAVTCMGAGYLLYPLAHESFLFAMVQLFVGLAGGIATTTNLAMFMDGIPDGASRPKIMGLYAGALAGGHTVGNLVGGVAGDTLGYTLAFQLGALMSFGSLAFLWFDRGAAPARSTRHKAAGPVLPLTERITGTARAMSEPRLVVISLVAFLLNFLHSMISTFFPLYGISIGLSLSEIGMLKSVHSLVNAFARPVAGAPIKVIGATRAAMVGLALMAVLDSLIPFQTIVWGFGILLAAIGLIRAIVLVGNTVELASVDETRISRGMASGLFSSAQDIGMLSSPALCGALASVIGLTTMMSIVPVASAGVFFLAVLWQKQRERNLTAIPAS